MKINESNKQDDYNDVFNNLQDYMLNEANIKRSLEMKLETTNIRALKGKTEEKIMGPKNIIFVPKEKEAYKNTYFTKDIKDKNKINIK